jgi:hypothetical protein
MQFAHSWQDLFAVIRISDIFKIESYIHIRLQPENDTTNREHKIRNTNLIVKMEVVNTDETSSVSSNLHGATSCYYLFVGYLTKIFQ